MPFRSSFRAALCLAGALSVAGLDAYAQDATRDSDDSFPVGAKPNPKPLSSDSAALSTVAASRPSVSFDAPPATPSQVPDPTPADVDSLASAAQQQSIDRDGPYYGKVKPKRAKLFKPNPKTSPPLRPLVPYRGAPGLPRGTLNPAPVLSDAIDPRQPAPTVAVIQSPIRVRRPLPEDDPFAPLGVAAGSLRLFPFVEATTGYESNPNQVTTGAKASAVLRASAGLDIKSDYSTNSLTASLRGGYTDYPSNSAANRPDASGVVDGRIDVTRNDKIDLEGRFTLATQTPGSSLLAVPGSTFITNRPSILSEGFTVGETHSFNRLALSLRGTFDRVQYGDATQSSGTTLLFSQENYNDYGLITRASYELTPAVIPFVEVGGDARVRDNPVDLSGYARDSTGVTAKAGSTFEFSRLLTGTASAGYTNRHYDDKRLQNLSGPTVDGALIYTITPLTTATLRANTTVVETTLAGASGVLARSISLELAHVLFRNFTIGAIGTFQVNQYQGVSVNENYGVGTLKAAYNLTRDVQITSSASLQRLNSSLQGSSYTDMIFLVGMRLQR